MSHNPWTIVEIPIPNIYKLASINVRTSSTKLGLVLSLYVKFFNNYLIIVGLYLREYYLFNKRIICCLCNSQHLLATTPLHTPLHSFHFMYLRHSRYLLHTRNTRHTRYSAHYDYQTVQVLRKYIPLKGLIIKVLQPSEPLKISLVSLCTPCTPRTRHTHCTLGTESNVSVSYATSIE